MQLQLTSFQNILPHLSVFRTRTRRILTAVAIALLFLLAVFYHAAAALVGVPPTSATEHLYNAGVVICYLLIFGVLDRYYRKERLSAVRVYWATLLTGLLVVLVASFFLSLDSETSAFDPATALPQNLMTVLKLNVLSFLEAIFAFTLLMRFRELALFKRTKGSVRNWYMMLAVMFAAGMFMFSADPYAGLNTPAMLFVVAAVVLMVVNSFRLSWIVFLDFREKLVLMALALGLLILLSVGLSDGASGLSFGASGEPFGRVYSYPLNLFTTLTIMFGIIYCTTSLLSLMFHLPTTGTIQRKAGEISAMHSFSKLVGQVHEPEKLISTIVTSTVEAETAQASWLALRDPRSGSLKPRVVAAHNIDVRIIEENIDVAALVEDAIAREQPLLLNQAAADHRLQVRPGDGIGSLVVVPLFAREENIGALFVSKEVAYGFESDDIEALMALGSQAAMALDNARLFVEQIEKERLSRELSIAREVQKKLLPQSVPKLEGISIAATSISAHEVGGDYYDFAAIDQHHLGIIVGDVSGKGTSAAFYMAELKGIFQALARLNLSPATFLVHANDALASSLERNAFISATYGILDLEEEEFRYARAGHCPIAHVSKEGTGTYLRSKGLGLGLNRGTLFKSVLEEGRIPLRAGDIFVLYTDGLVESRNEKGEEYGYDRLLDLLRRNRQLSAIEVYSLILKELKAFIQNDHFDDDLTLVILKWNGKGDASVIRDMHEQENHKEEALKGDSLQEAATLFNTEDLA